MSKNEGGSGSSSHGFHLPLSGAARDGARDRHVESGARSVAGGADSRGSSLPRRREASPKVDRGDKFRGDSPLRMSYGGSSGRGSSASSRTPSYDGRQAASPHRHPADRARDPQPILGSSAGQFGGLLGTLRNTPAQLKGPGTSSSRGMASWRSGPVKAHRPAHDMFPDAALRKSTRPATAPGLRPGPAATGLAPAYGSRPNSPVIRSSSRPGRRHRSFSRGGGDLLLGGKHEHNESCAVRTTARRDRKKDTLKRKMQHYAALCSMMSPKKFAR